VLARYWAQSQEITKEGHGSVCRFN
jgi:hypothetical protein